MYFQDVAILSHGKRTRPSIMMSLLNQKDMCPLFEQTQILFTQWWFVPGWLSGSGEEDENLIIHETTMRSLIKISSLCMTINTSLYSLIQRYWT